MNTENENYNDDDENDDDLVFRLSTIEARSSEE